VDVFYPVANAGLAAPVCLEMERGGRDRSAALGGNRARTPNTEPRVWFPT
jgi:hypothetical protein